MSTPQPESLQGRSLAVSLTVTDIQRSLDWYTGVLGFAVHQRHEPGGQLRAVSLRAGDVRVLLNQDDGARGHDRAKGEGFSMMITTTQDVDAVAAGIRERGGTFATEPSDSPFSGRFFRITDPDGFRFTVTAER